MFIANKRSSKEPVVGKNINVCLSGYFRYSYGSFIILEGSPEEINRTMSLMASMGFSCYNKISDDFAKSNGFSPQMSKSELLAIRYGEQIDSGTKMKWIVSMIRMFGQSGESYAYMVKDDTHPIDLLINIIYRSHFSPNMNTQKIIYPLSSSYSNYLNGEAFVRSIVNRGLKAKDVDLLKVFTETNVKGLANPVWELTIKMLAAVEKQYNQKKIIEYKSILSILKEHVITVKTDYPLHSKMQNTKEEYISSDDFYVIANKISKLLSE